MTKLNDLYSYCTKRGGDNFYGAGIKFTFLALVNAWYGIAAYLRKIAKSCWSTVCTLQNTFCQNIKVATCEENWRCWVSSSWYSVLRGNEAFLRGRVFFASYYVQIPILPLFYSQHKNVAKTTLFLRKTSNNNDNSMPFILQKRRKVIFFFARIVKKWKYCFKKTFIRSLRDVDQLREQPALGLFFCFTLYFLTQTTGFRRKNASYRN